VHRVAVDGFWIDEQPVTNIEFRRFVKATGYVTVAERPLDPEAYPDADPTLLVPGSLVFTPTRGPVALDDVRSWWRYVPGACWQRPEGPGSDTYTRGRHPVTHVAHEDALASNQQNAETAAQPVTYALLTVYFASYIVLAADPEGTLASVLTVFPLTAPLVLPARSALVGVPLWEHALAIVLVLAAIYALVRFAGRVYALGLLHGGSGLGLRAAWRIAREH
jgi:hypothetical protein